ncbi:MAG: amidase [Paracoccus denitrificans]|nr:MAG: amidase [Paracoccus denitrificans]PZO83917.1 MAG: amidase [Paracoccus denitrificans]
MDWLTKPATEQGRAILAGLVSPVDLTEGYLDAIAANPDEARIFARQTPIRARGEAMAAHDRARAGQRRGLLDGVALAWKDNIDSANIATEAGSRLLEGRTPVRDAAILRIATMQGAVCLGKTHMTELAFSGLGVNPSTATPPNSIDPALAPGGSSSGSAVAVALGLAAAAIGTDTGGSIRLPAAWNDLVGFKPTHGRINMDGVVPLCESFDVAGPIARNVEDCAELTALLTGHPAPDLRGDRPRGLRFVVLDGLPFDGADSAPVHAFEEAVDRLAQGGIHITHARSAAADLAMQEGTPLYSPEAYGIWRAQIEDAPELMHQATLARFRRGQEMSAPDFVAGWVALRRARSQWLEEITTFDAAILPTSPILPPDAARAASDDGYFTDRNMLSLRNTRIGNVLGCPSISLPTGRPACGLMLIGRPGADLSLLVTAAAVEAALGVA